MPNIRRGVPPGVPLAEFFLTAAKAGSIESRNGSERAMPAPRKNLRREMAWRVATKGPLSDVFAFIISLFFQEQFTLHDLMHQRAHTIASRPAAGENLS